MPPVGKHSNGAKRIKLSTSAVEHRSKSSCRARNDGLWNLYKEDIRRAYVDEDKTLRETMEVVGVAASERKWKEKLKEWGFQKNIPASDLAILVSKLERRLRVEGKDTVFYLKSGVDGRDLVEIKREKLDGLKKRKAAQVVPSPSPDAKTPPNIVYYTPRQEMELPGPEKTPERHSSPRIDPEFTTKYCFSENPFSWEETHNTIEQSGQQPESSYSEYAGDIPMSTHNYEPQTMPDLSQSRSQSNPSTFNNFTDPELSRFDQTAIPQHDSQKFASIVGNQNNGEISRYNMSVPQVHQNGFVELQRFSCKDQPALEMLPEIPVVAPMTWFGRFKSPTFPGGDGRDISVTEYALTSTNSFEYHLVAAQRHAAHEEIAWAEYHYMAAIAKCLQSGESHKVKRCLNELSMFSKQDRTPEYLRCSILTCRNILSLLEEEPSSTRGMKISGMVMLADLLARDGQLVEAESIYSQTLDLFALTDDSDIHQACISELGKILYRLWNSNEEPVREQVQIFATLLAQDLCEDTLRSALATLSAVKNRLTTISSHHPCFEFRMIVIQVSDLLSKQIKSRSSRFESELRKSTMKLALACSELRWNDNADALIRAHIGWLEGLPTGDWGYEKIRGYICCSTHFLTKEDSEECIKTITAAYKAMEDLLYSRNSELYRPHDLPLFEEIKCARARVRPNTCSKPLIKLVEGLEARLEKMIEWNRASCYVIGGKHEEASDKERHENAEQHNDEGNDEDSDGDNERDSDGESYDQSDGETEGDLSEG